MVSESKDEEKTGRKVANQANKVDNADEQRDWQDIERHPAAHWLGYRGIYRGDCKQGSPS